MPIIDPAPTPTPEDHLRAADQLLADPQRYDALAHALTGLLGLALRGREEEEAEDRNRELFDDLDASIGRVLALADELEATDLGTDRINAAAIRAAVHGPNPAGETSEKA